MPLKKEPCRNFQRGNCRYGDRCKFLHATQQQSKPNAFGFGSQTASPFQQQKSNNPFGFGVQNSGPTSGAPNAGGLGQKPFDNKWVRSEQQQPTNQSQASHQCSDPDSCKRLIGQDFQHERPLWKLTCYGHDKYLPCDITGDISYEELRAVAYDDAKRGTNLQAIVERERSLVKSKEVEFENLRQNPYTKNAPPAHSNQSLFPAVGANTASPTPQNSGPSPFSAASQQSPSSNLLFGARPSTTSNSGFGQFQGPGPFGSKSINSGSFGSQVPAQTGGNLFGFGSSGTNNQSPQVSAQTGGNLFGFGSSGTNNQGPQVPAQTGPFTSNLGGFGNSGGMSSQGTQAPAQTGLFTSNIGGFGTSGGMSNQGPQVPVQTGPSTSNIGGFGNSGGMSAQVPVQTSPFTSNVGGFGNSGGMSSQGSQLPSTPSVSLQSHTSAANNSSMLFTGLGGAKGEQQTKENNSQGTSATDTGIWLKNEWKCGEIPEQAPPAAYCR